MPKRTRGGQPGNQNAVTHGRYRARALAERRAALAVEAEKRRVRDQAWTARMPVIDYKAICEQIQRSSPQTGGASKNEIQSSDED